MSIVSYTLSCTHVLSSGSGYEPLQVSRERDVIVDDRADKTTQHKHTQQNTPPGPRLNPKTVNVKSLT
jgi:hypothetical protein